MARKANFYPSKPVCKQLNGDGPRMDCRDLVSIGFKHRRHNVVVFKKDKVTLLISFIIACFATWPLIVNPTINISRHFDLYGVLWLAEGVQFIEEWRFTHTNFPMDASIGHIDSWLWFGLFWLNHDIIPIDTLVALLVTASITLNIWCARWCALVWGIAPIPAWCVGLLFGLSGSMLNSILEGSWYLTSQFWLPMIAISLLRFQQSKSYTWYTWLNISWLGALLTSAYLGLVSSLMLLFLTLYIQPYRHRRKWFITVLGPVIAMGVLFTAFFLSVYNRREFDNLGMVNEWASMGSSTFWNYLLWNPGLDTYAHSLGPIGSIFILMGLLLAPAFKLPSSWRIWWLLGTIGFVLSFGFQVTLKDEYTGIPWILQAFANQDWISFIHFPVRFHWITDLSGAILFGLIVTQYVQRTRLQLILVGAVMLHVFWIQGWHQRKGARPIAKEAIYSTIKEGHGAIFEMYPVFSSYSNVDPLDIKNQLCLQQLEHHRPLLISCMGTRTDDSVDWTVRTSFLSDTLDTPTHKWDELFPQIGVDTIVLHRNWFSKDDLAQVDTMFAQWFGEPATESDSGHIQIWTLSGVVSDRNDAKLALRTHFPEFQ